MKTIKFNNKEYDIPQNWDEVTIGMLIKSSELSDLLSDAPLIAVLSAYTGIPVNELRLSNAGEVKIVIDIMDFISVIYEPTPESSFIFNGEEYKCNEELIEQPFEDWVSIQTTMHNFKDDQVRALPRLVAILCKKDGETLNDFKLDERSKLMLSLPMTKAKNIEAFFLHSLNAYRAVTLLSSITKEEENILLAKLQELQNTVSKSKEQSGISWLTKLQIGLLQTYLKLWKGRLVRYYNSTRTKS